MRDGTAPAVAHRGKDTVRPSLITPTGVERTFGVDEIIVSKTDPQGRITYANPVFLRVSAYSEDQLLGKPHSVVRHPDMPRILFKLLWDTIAAGQEIFAYINNLAADGAHYWVLAHVTPSHKDGRLIGYHSNRRLPERAAVAEVSRLTPRCAPRSSGTPRRPPRWRPRVRCSTRTWPRTGSRTTSSCGA